MSLDSVFDKHDAANVNTLAKYAAKSHAAGDIDASGLLNVSINLKQVQSNAIAYTKQYKKDLVEKGGTWVVGGPNMDKKIFKPWFADASKEQRKTVAQIISDGIKNGKATGVKEYKRGGYPKNSIAAELHEHFNTRRSHASMVARTETRRIQYEGAVSRWQENKVKNLKWLHSHLPNARKEHVERDGRIYVLGEEPPLGEPNCRCVYVPVVPKPGEVIEPVKLPEPEPGIIEPIQLPKTDYKPVQDIRQDVIKENDRLISEQQEISSRRMEIRQDFIPKERELAGLPAQISEADARAESYKDTLKGIRAGKIPAQSPEVMAELEKQFNLERDLANMLEKRYDELQTELKKMSEEMRILNEQSNLLSGPHKQKMREMMAIRKPDPVTVVNYQEAAAADSRGFSGNPISIKPPSAYTKKQVDADNFLSSITSKEKYDNTFSFYPEHVDLSPKTLTVNVMEEGRASASVTAIPARINMAFDDNTKVFVHEMAHHIEYKNPDVYKSAVEMREKLSTGNEIKQLGTIIGNPRYGANEIAYVGNYPSSYMGKIYPDSGAGGSTEMVSMATEILYDDPVELATKHPDVFDWILTVLR